MPPPALSLRLRPARPDEAPHLTQLAHAAKAHWGYPPTLLAMWRADLTFTPAAIRDAEVWCAEHEGAVAGVVALAGAGAEREVEHLWVHPDHMGRGVGTALLRHACRTARAGGARRLRIVSDPHAEGFYRKRGGRCVGTEPSVPRGRRLPVLEITLGEATDDSGSDTAC